MNYFKISYNWKKNAIFVKTAIRLIRSERNRRESNWNRKITIFQDSARMVKICWTIWHFLVLDNNYYGRFCKSDGTQRLGENVGLRVVKYPLTPIDRAIVGKDSSFTMARIFWSLTVVGRRTLRDHKSLYCQEKLGEPGTDRKKLTRASEVIVRSVASLDFCRGTSRVPEIRTCAPLSIHAAYY